jgi:hypothetical protein
MISPDDTKSARLGQVLDVRGHGLGIDAGICLVLTSRKQFRVDRVSAEPDGQQATEG